MWLVNRKIAETKPEPDPENPTRFITRSVVTGRRGAIAPPHWHVEYGKYHVFSTF